MTRTTEASTGDGAAVLFVKNEPGAIGYIADGATAEGVKVLSVR